MSGEGGRLPGFQSGLRGGVDLLREIYDEAGTDNIFFLASGMTFSLLMASIPFLLLLVSAVSALFAPALNLSQDAALAWIADFLPVTEVLRTDVWESLIEITDISRAATPISAALFLWFSTRLFGSIRHVLDVVFDLRERPGILRGKWIDVQLVLAATFLLLCNVAITSAFSSVSSRLVARTPLPEGPTLTIIGTIVAFFVIFLMFLLIYKFLPAARLAWRTAAVSALVASIGFELVKYGLGYYLTEVADFSEVFSNLATVVLFILSFYYTAILFVLGAEVGKVLAFRRIMLRQREVFEGP